MKATVPATRDVIHRFANSSFDLIADRLLHLVGESSRRYIPAGVLKPIPFGWRGGCWREHRAEDRNTCEREQTTKCERTSVHAGHSLFALHPNSQARGSDGRNTPDSYAVSGVKKWFSVKQAAPSQPRGDAPSTPFRMLTTMTVKEVLAQLEALGDEGRRKHNAKSGAPENQFGVKLGDLRVVAKKIKLEADGARELALQLWDTGNVEAQMLATLILKPDSITAKALDTMTRFTTCAQVADWLNAYIVAHHPDKNALGEKWMKDKDRWAARAGWNLTYASVNNVAEGIDPVPLLDRIEKELAKADPVVQWTMNFTLGAIGIKFPKHRARAIKIGEKVGLYRDWPVSKGCIPPYVPVWIDAIVNKKT